jgi:hypothetical protein
VPTLPGTNWSGKQLKNALKDLCDSLVPEHL